MQNCNLKIKRQHTGASPETFQLTLNLLTVTASLFINSNTFLNVNKKCQFRIHGGGNPNSSGNHETRGESELLQGIISAKFSFQGN